MSPKTYPRAAGGRARGGAGRRRAWWLRARKDAERSPDESAGKQFRFRKLPYRGLGSWAQRQKLRLPRPVIVRLTFD